MYINIGANNGGEKFEQKNTATSGKQIPLFSYQKQAEEIREGNYKKYFIMHAIMI